MQILELIVIDYEIEDRRRLEEIGLAGALFGRAAHAIDEIGLDTEKLGIDRNDKAGFTILDSAQNYPSGFMQFHVV